MAKFKLLEQKDGRCTYVFWCPGCEEHHAVWTGTGSPSWHFNNNVDAPTISPSLLITKGPKADPITHLAPKDAPKRICHSFISDGKIQFLSDCTHSLAGKTFELPEYD